MDAVFMVRGSTGVGPFNTDFNWKIAFFIVLLIILWWRWQSARRSDYLWVTIFGTMIWTLTEAMLQLSGVRVFQPPQLLGWNLPTYVSLVIQGWVEGAFVAVVGLLFADLYVQCRKWTVIGFFVLMLVLGFSAFTEGVQIPHYGGEVPSRRNMISMFPLIGLSLATYATIAFLFPIDLFSSPTNYLRIRITEASKSRARRMFVFMTLFGIVWTLSEWAAGTRWIEIGVPMATRHAPPMIEIGAFIFDILIEISAAYVPFFTIPVGLKLIDQD